ncbi:CLUMA_CG000353, isoform A [Clunio marinus]|uniref:CLUMA_CG000353, isoform A n=1 Tax=Clunio marinus TaxID=568069 RepID=A0A1J1HF45_9DIPT|nr:CLUMA_CG000353, isoform A [Clunio marinus]
MKVHWSRGKNFKYIWQGNKQFDFSMLHNTSKLITSKKTCRNCKQVLKVVSLTHGLEAEQNSARLNFMFFPLTFYHASIQVIYWHSCFTLQLLTLVLRQCEKKPQICLQ